jgi:hypothetical protein
MRGFVVTQISKRLDMRQVSSLVTAFFFPIACFICAISPLANAALYLMIECNTHQDSNTVKLSFDPHHSECEGDSLDRDRREVFMEDNPVVILALEPHHVDGLLDDRVSIWVLRNTANIDFLYAKELVGTIDDDAMGRTR